MAKASLKVGETFSKRYEFDAAEIVAFAKAAHDPNPLHHDEAWAKRTRFGGLIACGAHTTGVFTSLCAEWFSERFDTVGLEFSFRLRRAVPAGLSAFFTWSVTSVEPAEKHGGVIATVEGTISDADGRVYTLGKGTVLACPKGSFLKERAMDLAEAGDGAA